ncbi:hypothetical protein [Paraconexibacter algicola]|uniref:Uncharacterized protein n=1 Tax=Paraconexibacter algicola TaxID=2133960 RepID=A0A2T4UBJ1_9ACTN|nr:hypothetical protein [Paraconexibacter algicola]PTL54262.1 hypothetical protein C7Y72_21165 [Paraconexibacter algicola]
MAGNIPARRGRRWAAAAAAVLAAGVLVPSTASSQLTGDNDLPINPQWLANTLGNATNIGQVKNNTIPGAIERRDKAVAEWKAAQAAFEQGKGKQPSPLAKPTYNVVWSSKQNVADVHADVISKLVTNATVNPQGLADLLNPQFLPGLDGFQVIDTRKINLDGSENPDYGRVVNFVQLPLPWGLENEAHHMQYEWEDGDPILAGSLFIGTTHVLGADDIPNLKLLNEIAPTEYPGGTIADAYEKGPDGRFLLTLMGGPLANFGGSPGQLVTFKPDKEKGVVVESAVSAGNIGGVLSGNAGGVPEPCSVREARPLGTCANPHGIQIRNDLGWGLTSDYAEPREIVLDPVKTVDKYAFRPTIRSWDTSKAGSPVLKGVANVPDGPLEPANRAHEQYGIMENAKTYPDARKKYGGIDSKGFFAGSMCGGGVFFVPDITKAKGDFSDQVVQVWNDGLSIIRSGDGGNQKFSDEPGGCAGGAWHQVTPNNKLLFRAVQGRNPASDNYFDQGQAKLIYDIDISPVIESAQDGTVECDLSRGIKRLNLTGIQVFNKLAKGEVVADCPKFVDALKVNDVTSGGPHWAAFDNHSIDQNGVPWRLTFSNYFVSRTGVDGDHRLYAVDVSPEGKLSYDDAWRDEKTGALGVNFNRRNWPGNPDAGFYKPHSEIWVCPPGICPTDAKPAVRAVAAANTKSCASRRNFTIRLDKVKGHRVLGGTVTVAGKKAKAAKRNAKTGRYTTTVDLRSTTKKKVKVTLRIKVRNLKTGKTRTITRTRTYTTCAVKK